MRRPWRQLLRGGGRRVALWAERWPARSGPRLVRRRSQHGVGPDAVSRRGRIAQRRVAVAERLVTSWVPLTGGRGRRRRGCGRKRSGAGGGSSGAAGRLPRRRLGRVAPPVRVVAGCAWWRVFQRQASPVGRSGPRIGCAKQVPVVLWRTAAFACANTRVPGREVCAHWRVLRRLVGKEMRCPGPVGRPPRGRRRKQSHGVGRGHQVCNVTCARPEEAGPGIVAVKEGRVLRSLCPGKARGLRRLDGGPVAGSKLRQRTDPSNVLRDRAAAAGQTRDGKSDRGYWQRVPGLGSMRRPWLVATAGLRTQGLERGGLVAALAGPSPSG